MTWSFGGTTLSMVANDGMYAVEEIASAYDLPKIRGSNPKIPLREGRVHVAKIYDERVITLGMWVAGSSQSDYEDRIDTLKQLFGSRNRQLLSRTMTDGSVRQAYAEVVSQLGFNIISPLSGRFTVDFLLAEPFMRSDTQTDTGQIAISSNPHDFTLTNPGTASDRSAVITFHGTLENPKLINQDNDVWVGYSGSIGGSNSEVIRTADFSIDSEDYDNLSHSGDNYFMVLNPGDNSMRLQTDTTGGWIQVAFYAPYL